MRPRQAQAWLEAHKWLQEQDSPPSILAQEAEKRAKAAIRTAKPWKPAVRLPRGLKARVKKVSIPKLKKDLDRVFSLFIRQRDSDPATHFGRCCTCGFGALWKEMDCGHYQPRQDLATRWDERNCHLQDKACNGFRGGEAEKMASYIDAKYGAGTAESLRALARQPFKLSRQWLEAKIAYYRYLVRE